MPSFRAPAIVTPPLFAAGLTGGIALSERLGSARFIVSHIKNRAPGFGLGYCRRNDSDGKDG